MHPRNNAMSLVGVMWCCLIGFNKVQQLKDSGPFGIILSFKLSKSKQTSDFCGVTDLPLGKTEESQEFFSRGIITILYFIINYSKDEDFSTIYREQETFLIVQFFLFQRQVGPTATSLWPWHPANALLAFHGAPFLLSPSSFPRAQPHEGVKIWHFFLDLCFPRTSPMIYLC